MLTRRQFLKTGAAVAAYLALPGSLSWRGAIQKAFAEYVANNTLDPALITQFAAPLVIPPAMPLSKGSNKNKDKYKIAVRQFSQQILPSSQFGATTVWSYGSIDNPGTFNYPAFTIEAKWNKDTQVQWSNELVDAAGVPLPHLLPVDATLHWANPIGRKDTRPNPIDDPDYWTNPYLNGQNGSYTGPVPMVTHVHGAHTHEDSDGYPEAWYLPASAAADPNIAAATGTYFDIFNSVYGHGWMAGTATFKYPNTQRATTLWYHDHTLGMTRLNVYAGPAGFWLIRGGPDDVVTVMGSGAPAVLPSPAPATDHNPFDHSGVYEIPIAFQDRSFADPLKTTSGLPDLWYPNYRAFFEDLGDVPDFLKIPFTYDELAQTWGYALNGDISDVAPIWQPEFFGNVMVVNGVSWPKLQVEQQQYRFRLLNGCNSRFLILDFSAISGVQVWQIGADGGFLKTPVNVTMNRGDQILMGPAERADVIVDFRGVAPGNYVLGNLGPDEPFGGDPVGEDPPMPEMRNVMRFDVSAGSTLAYNAFTDPSILNLPGIVPLTPTVPNNPRKVSLNEEMSHAVFVPFDADADEFVLDTNGTLWEVAEGASSMFNQDTGFYEYSELPGVTWNRAWTADVFGPTSALLGDITGGVNTPRLWMEPVTENPAAGTTEEWEIHNFTVDAHPIHIHLVQFQVIGRGPTGTERLPEPGETGFKDTVIAYPGEVTKVIAMFDIPGRFVWHCHIVEHEDNEMMRPYNIV